MNAQRIAEIRERLDKATPGPWFVESHGIMDEYRSRTIVLTGEGGQDDADAALIACAPDDIAYLLGEVERAPVPSEEVETPPNQWAGQSTLLGRMWHHWNADLKRRMAGEVETPGWAEFFAERKQAGMGSFWLPPEIAREMPLGFICGMVCTCGPNLEPLACGYKHGHDGEHAWASLPTFVAGEAP